MGIHIEKKLICCYRRESMGLCHIYFGLIVITCDIALGLIIDKALMLAPVRWK